jgi:RNA polymerase sigma factor (sigma-70 family)
MSFPMTNWDILQALRTGDADQRSGMLGEIVTIYGPPLFAFARHESHGSLTRQDCEDVVSDFFLKCVEEDIIERADPEKGRFRNFLARSFRNFMLNWIRDRSARVRAPSGGLVSIHELVDRHGHALEPRAGESADQTLDRVFRLTLFETALAAFEKSCGRQRQEKKFLLYMRREVIPEREGTAPPPYSALAEEYGLPSEDAVGRVVRTARDEFQSLLLALIRQDAVSSTNVQTEFKLVLATGLQRAGSEPAAAGGGWFSRLRANLRTRSA